MDPPRRNYPPSEHSQLMEESTTYLQKNKVPELFESMMSMLAFDRPDDPRAYLIEKLKQLKMSRDNKVQPPCLFNEENTEAMFTMMDPVEKGTITLAQYKEAMKSLGVEHFNTHPPGAERNAITKEVFMKEARDGLRIIASTFADR